MSVEDTTITQGPVEVDTDEADSSYGESLQSYTTSLTSSVKNHSYENGRRYHAYQSGKYFMPNDEDENDRMDMHHHLATLLLEGKLHVAPIGDHPQRILDVGTGTGIWAIEIGDQYPSAEVLGVDLSPTQPSMVPPNVKFEVDDVESEWTHPAPFDLVHVRFLAGSLVDYKKLVDQAFKFTAPGGWCEFKDWDTRMTSPDDSIPKDSALAKYHHMLYQGLVKIGRVWTPGPDLKKWVEDAGYEEVTERILNLPVGIWPKDKKLKEIGTWNYVCLVEGLEAIGLRLFTSVLGWELDEIQVLLAQVRSELKDKSIHFQYTYHVVTGRKPSDATSATPEV